MPNAIMTNNKKERGVKNTGLGSIFFHAVALNAGTSATEIAMPIPVPVSSLRLLFGWYRPGLFENKLKKEFNPSTAKSSTNIEIGTMICQEGIPTRRRPIIHW